MIVLSNIRLVFVLVLSWVLLSSAENANNEEYSEVTSFGYNNVDSGRLLSGSCIKTPQEGSSCINCLNSTVVNATTLMSDSMGWCTDPKFCFDASVPSNVIDCSSACNGDIYYTVSDDDYESQCKESSLSFTTIVLVFVLVVVCPICLVGTCIALLCYRCHNAINNKIAISREYGDNDLLNTVAPVPVLHVYNSTGGANGTIASAAYANNFAMTAAVVAVQEPTVINLDDVNGFSKSPYARTSLGGGGAAPIYSPNVTTSNSSSNRYGGQQYSPVVTSATNVYSTDGNLHYDTKVDV